MTDTASTNQEAAMRGITEQYVADLPPSTDCSFNVAKKGQHRFCSRMGRKEIGGRYFCQRHADVIAQAILESVSELQAERGASHD